MGTDAQNLLVGDEIILGVVDQLFLGTVVTVHRDKISILLGPPSSGGKETLTLTDDLGNKYEYEVGERFTFFSQDATRCYWTHTNSRFPVEIVKNSPESP